MSSGTQPATRSSTRAGSFAAPTRATAGSRGSARKFTEDDVSRVAFAPSDGRRCYAATSTGNFYRAKKTTHQWIKAHTPENRPSANYITGIAVSRSDMELVYVLFGGCASPRAMRSTDGGSHWVDRCGAGMGALPAIPVNTIVVDRDNDDVVYIGTDIGIFRTQDAGLSWHDFNDGLAGCVAHHRHRTRAAPREQHAVGVDERARGVATRLVRSGLARHAAREDEAEHEVEHAPGCQEGAGFEHEAVELVEHLGNAEGDREGEDLLKRELAAGQ